MAGQIFIYKMTGYVQSGLHSGEIALPKMTGYIQSGPPLVYDSAAVEVSHTFSNVVVRTNAASVDVSQSYLTVVADQATPSVELTQAFLTVVATLATPNLEISQSYVTVLVKPEPRVAEISFRMMSAFSFMMEASHLFGDMASPIEIAADFSGTSYHTGQGAGKVIDAREGRSDLVVLGKALVLPASNNDEGHGPLDGSLRFHDLTGWPQVFHTGEWHTLGSSAGGPGEMLHIDQFTLVGRDLPGVGEPHQIAVGEGLYIFDGVLRTTTMGGSGRNVICGAINGTLNHAEPLPLGIVPWSFSAHQDLSYARAEFAATNQTVVSIWRKRGENRTLMGFFTWEPGEKDADVAFFETDLQILDMVYLEGPTQADSTLANFTFLIRPMG